MQIQSELGDEEEGHDDGGDEGDDAAGERAAVEILVDLGVRVQVPELAENAVHLRLGYNLPPKPPKKKRKKKSSVGGGDFPRSLSLSLASPRRRIPERNRRGRRDAKSLPKRLVELRLKSIPKIGRAHV